MALIAAGPLWGPGLLNTRGGGDSPFLLLRVHQMTANLRSGVFPVRWMPDAAYGLGYPFFSYYAALPYYLAAGFVLVGLSILDAIKLTHTIFLAAAALAMYGWVKRVLVDSARKSNEAIRSAAAWLAAAAYTLAPFHLVNIYVRGDSLSEFAAFAFYPLILWGLDRLAERPSLRRAIPPALAYAGLILTHNVSALIFSPFVLLYVAFHVLRFTLCVSRRTLHASHFTSTLIAPLLLALLLSAWFWVPALAETDYVQLTAQASGYFFYGRHFRAGDLIQPTLIFDYTISPGSLSPFAMGLVQALLASVGALIVIVGRVLSRYATHNAEHTTRSTFHTSRFAHFATHLEAFILIGFILSTWLITPLSRPLWDHLPLLPMTQFPWRFLSVQAFFAAFLTGGLVMRLDRHRWLAATALTLLLGISALAGLRPEYLPITPEDVTVERLQLYELFTGNIGSTIRYEYLPRWAKPRPHTGPSLFNPDASPRAIPLSGELAHAEEIAHQPTRRTWSVGVESREAELAFPIHYWPGWRAKVDGSRVAVKPAPSSGYLTLSIPSGTHTVEMWLGRTPLRAAAEVVSLIVLLAVIALWLSGGEGEQQISPVACPRFALPAGIFAVALSLLVAFGPRAGSSITSGSDLTMDFEQMPYLHHNPAGVDLGTWKMQSYRLSDRQLDPGDQLRVVVKGKRKRHPAKATLRLISPAAVRRDNLPPIAESKNPLPEVGTFTHTMALTVPRQTPPGLHLMQLAGSDGTTQKSTYLQPVWVNFGGVTAGQPVQKMFADGALQLHAIETTQPQPDRLDVRIGWGAAEPVAANYSVSLRLTDSAGNEWAHLDTQPGYGFLPTSLWPAERPIHDRYSLSLPQGIPPGNSYTLEVNPYRVTTLESVGKHTLPVSLSQVTLRPDAPVIARFRSGDSGDVGAGLSRLDVPERVRQGESLNMTAYWLATEQLSKDYITEWRLEGSEMTISDTLPLAPGSPPTGWPAGAWIAGRARLSVPPTASPGDYTLSLTLREPDGTPLGTHTYPHSIEVEGRERVWQLPPMQREVGARFGEMIELAGYDLQRGSEELRLTLYWRALKVPDQHYKFFVHLADPDTGQPVRQIDTMPKNFTYPTGMWAPGEVVTDVVRLPLKDVPGGRYELAVGWYDPESKQRLQARARDGSPYTDNRVILPEDITVAQE